MKRTIQNQTFVLLCVGIGLPSAARADDTSILTKGRTVVRAEYVDYLQAAPQGRMDWEVLQGQSLLGYEVDANTRMQNHVRAQALVVSARYGWRDDVTFSFSLPYFTVAETRVQRFKVKAMGIDVTSSAQEFLAWSGYRDPDGRGSVKPMSTWRGSGLGDATMLARYQFRRERKWRAAATFGLQIPTGERDDPALLTDFGLGDGQTDLLAAVGVDWKENDNLFINGTAGFRLQAPDMPKTQLFGLGPEMKGMRDLGDIFSVGGETRTTLLGKVPVSVGYRMDYRFKDSFNPDFGDPGQGTGGIAHVFAAAAGVSNIRQVRGHRLPHPVSFAMTTTRGFSLNPRLESQQVGVRADVSF